MTTETEISTPAYAPFTTTAVPLPVSPVGVALPPGSQAVWTPGHVMVCSVYPEKLTRQLTHMGFYTYELGPPDPQTGYALMPVYDNFQLIRNPYSINADETIPAPQSCRSIAESLVQGWAGDTIGVHASRAMGIGIIMGNAPTAGELAALRSKQEEYFRYLIEVADDYYARDETKYIDKVHRLALRWMGSEDRPWAKPIEPIMLKTCPACAEKIRHLATVCKHCRTNLIVHYNSSGYRPTVEEDAHVLSLLNRPHPEGESKPLHPEEGKVKSPEVKPPETKPRAR